MEENPLTHYVIVRADLPRGIQAANIVHAAGESSPGFLKPGTYAVVLTTPNEEELLKLVARLYTAGVLFVSVTEPDPPYNGQLMAIGVIPRRKKELRRHFSSLPLLK